MYDVHVLPVGATVTIVRREKTLGQSGVSFWSEFATVAFIILFAPVAHLIEIAVVRKNCVRERIRVNATLLHCDLLTGRGREGKLANTTIDGEYNLSGQELPLSIMRLYLPPHGQIRQCCSETQNRDYLL